MGALVVSLQLSNSSQSSSGAQPELSIDLAAIVDNWRILRKQARSTVDCGAVLKADAYGLGAIPVANALYHAGCRTFFVAYPQEALALARQGLSAARIYVLLGPTVESVHDIHNSMLVPVLSTPEHVELWEGSNLSAARNRACALQVETGMHRLGLSEQILDRLLQDRARWKQINPILILSHLACADEPESDQNVLQQRVFENIVSKAEQLDSNLAFSLANSSGTLLGAEFHYDVLRPGIGLFGGIAGVSSLGFRQPLTMRARILQIESVKRGQQIGYGGTYTARKDSRIATAAIGYADGLSRDLNKNADGMILGERVRIVGRTSMDVTTFDVSNVPSRRLENASHIEIINSSITVEEFASRSNTIAHEFLTRLGPRVRRRYHWGDQ